MSYQAGSIVKVRGREWVVLPQGDDRKIVNLKPLGGHEAETVGILPGIEKIEDARFAPPDPERLGDWTGARLLREAARLSTRNAAGAIRCWSRIDAEPRPYQLVPLLLALRQSTVRLLIADDVGIGKTIESLLIARELYDRGEISRIAVLAPPALVDQWVREMGSKFHLDAVPVLTGTAARLEKGLPAGRSLFEEYPITVVSLDFIKAERRRAEFLRTCPEFVIVDEAHSCAPSMDVKHQRFQLLESLAKDPGRHMLLVTATPHSGKDESFNSLVGLLSPEIAKEAAAGRDIRELLASHFVQRRRPDIRAYLDTTTAFPKREERESNYVFSDAYRELFNKVLDYVQTSMREVEAGTQQHRVRWWSALALLRALGSSPNAVIATLLTRAVAAGAMDAAEANQIASRVVLDQDVIDAGEGMDVVGGADLEDESTPDTATRRKLRELARSAAGIAPAQDSKLQLLIKELKALLSEGFHPIVFCRFIETAAYVAKELTAAFKKDKDLKDKLEIACVTGTLAPEDRRARIAELSEEKTGEKIPVLVATDCLSEGVNLQDRFTAVVHYDLAWNPTRHEQREGRVDRFGQRCPTVRALTMYGANNPVDGIVLDILIRKHKLIRTATGVSIPVPMDSNDVLSAIMEGFDFRSTIGGSAKRDQLEFDLGQDMFISRKRLHTEWDDAAKRDTDTRTRFAQRTIRPEEVALELAELRAAAGDQGAVRWFFEYALKRAGAGIEIKASDAKNSETLRVDPTGLPPAVRDQLRIKNRTLFGFDDKAPQQAILLGRSHPMVSGLAAQVMEGALDDLAGNGDAVASRAGVVRTDVVKARTVLILARFRYDIGLGRGQTARVDLAEDLGAIAFRTGPQGPEVLTGAEAEALFGSAPSGNVPRDLAIETLRGELEKLGAKSAAVAAEGMRRAAVYAASFARLRDAARLKGGATTVVLRGDPDILGLYVYLPAGGKQ